MTQPGRHEELTDTADLRARLRHVRWIGGGSGAGKTTIARRLAARYGWRHYATDDVMGDHARRTTPQEAPFLHEFMAMDMDERWVNRSPKAMLETFPWFRGEGFDLIVEDLLRLPREPGVVVEGFRLLPRLVEPLLSSRAHAVWLLPAPEFRQRVFASRKKATSDRALQNLLERDRMFTETLREETAQLALPVIDVDASMAEDALVRRVTELFEL